MNTSNHDAESAVGLYRRAPHPAAHAVVAGIVLMFVTLVGWAALSEIDIVAIAPGTVIPQSRSKPVQAATNGVVAVIAVADGDRVEAGALLVALDEHDTRAELKRLSQNYRAARNEWLLNTAFLHALDSDLLTRQSTGVLARRSLASLLASSDHEYAVELQQRLAQRISAYRHELEALHARHAATQREARALDARREFLVFDVPRAEESLASYEHLMQQQLVSRERYLRAEREHQERVQNLHALNAEHDELLEKLNELDASLKAYSAKERQQASDAAVRYESEFRNIELQMEQIRQELERLTVRAPIAGEVQQVNIRGPGAVVNRGDVLMMIVPAGALLEVEAHIANRDIGFIQSGQTAAVKVDAFRFTKYGYATGLVRTVSAESVDDGRGGHRYPARIALASPFIESGGHEYALQPGMRVNVEIRTGRRQILDYFLSPIRATAHQSIRER